MSKSSDRRSPAAIELLEDRRLLSASLSGSSAGAPVIAMPAATVVAPSVKTYGVTLRLQAGESFAGYLGDIVGAQLDLKTDRVSASINWGDGSQSRPGIVSIGASRNIDVSGMHTYSAAGHYSIAITVSAAPIPIPGQSTPAYVVLLGTIKSAAIVAGMSGPGVEIAETAGIPFTATVASFQFAAPAQGLSATINWGDGTSSAGELKAAGNTGLVRFDVDGTHTYARPGEYPIHIVVSQNTGTALRQVESISSKAVVTSRITGTYKVDASVPDAGAIYQFTGTGSTGNLPLTLAGSVTLPGFVASGSAAGEFILKTSQGTVTFAVTGPAEKGFGPFPSTLKFVVSGSTGMFADSTGSGTIAVALNADQKTFIFTLENVTSIEL